MATLRTTAHLLTLCFVASSVPGGSALAQSEITNFKTIASAKSVYLQNKSGVDAVGQKALAELNKWGRFQIAPDSQRADLIVVISTDPPGGNLILAGGQTGTIDSQGRIEEDRVPNFNKLEPVRYGSLTVTDARSGKSLWVCAKRWGGLLTGFNSIGERLVKEFEKQVQLADQRSRLKLIKSIDGVYPPEASRNWIEGVVVVRISVDKNGAVTEPKALSGPPELFQASVDAAKQWRFEPPEHAPITTDLEFTYKLGPKPCPPSKRSDHANIEYSIRPPTKRGHRGELRVLKEINLPSPPYPDAARDAGIQGDLELFITIGESGDVIGARVAKSLDPVIDDAALAAVRTWRFKVSGGTQLNLPVTFRFRLSCW